MNKLYFAPGSCAIGIHVLLEEVGQPYEIQKVDLAKGEHYQPAYLAINSKSKVPSLQRKDGTVITEFPAIATWLALTNPDKKLLSTDPETMARTLETLDYVVSTLHMQGFTRVFKPVAFTPNEADHEAVKARGMEICKQGVANMDKLLEGKDYVTGTFSIADAALFYWTWWLAARVKMELPKNLDRFFKNMMARPSVQAMLKQEGLAAA